jgi:hypothetical protein
VDPLREETAPTLLSPHHDRPRAAACRFHSRREAQAVNEDSSFYYPTHGYEFLPYRDGTLFDLLMAETKPEYVHIEMDVYWIVHPDKTP